jgi:hypothetical protein
MSRAQLREQSTRRLEGQAAEVDRVDTAVVAAAKFGVQFPAFAVVIRALNDASTASAEVVDAHGTGPLPLNVRNGLLRLHCSVSDLVTSLTLYCVLGHSLSATVPHQAMSHRHGEASQLH